MVSKVVTIHRKSYLRKDGKRVKATSYKRKVSVGRSRGSKYGKYKNETKWINRQGKLGGHGYLSKSEQERRRLLRRCVKKYGYKSCLGSIIALERSSIIKSKYGPKLQKDREYLVKQYRSK